MYGVCFFQLLSPPFMLYLHFSLLNIWLAIDNFRTDIIFVIHFLVCFVWVCVCVPLMFVQVLCVAQVFFYYSPILSLSQHLSSEYMSFFSLSIVNINDIYFGWLSIYVWNLLLYNFIYYLILFYWPRDDSLEHCLSWDMTDTKIIKAVCFVITAIDQFDFVIRIGTHFGTPWQVLMAMNEEEKHE